MIERLIEFWGSWELFGDAVWVNCFAGAALGLLGVFVWLARMPFLSAALSQAAGFGMSLTLGLGLVCPTYAKYFSPRAGAALGALGAAGFIARAGLLGARGHDALTLCYLLGLGGTLAAMTRLPHEISDLESVLFGSGVAVAPGEVSLFLGVFCALVLLVGLLKPMLTEVFVDPRGASVRGVPVKRVATVFFSAIACIIALATTTLGALPVFSLSVLPAASIVMHARTLTWALVAASALGALMGSVGYFLAFCYAIPVGSAQTLLGLGFYLLSQGFTGWMRRPRAGQKAEVRRSSLTEVASL